MKNSFEVPMLTTSEKIDLIDTLKLDGVSINESGLGGGSIVNKVEVSSLNLVSELTPEQQLKDQLVRQTISRELGHEQIEVVRVYLV